MHFAITGVTISGNMGGTAMLVTAMDELSRMFPDARFSLLSISPERDRSRPLASAIDIVSAKPVPLLLLYLPLSILLWPVARFRPVRNALARMAYFRSLIDAGAVIDLCGIAFVDRRGLPLLAYNLACCLPPLILGIPVAKLAQALGPFRTEPNRSLAKFVLNRCGAVVARGETSLGYLRELGIEGATSLPDTSFAMDVRPQHQQAAEAMMPRFETEGRLLIVSPSEVVRRLSLRSGIQFENELIAFLQARIADGWNILLVPHSLGTGKSKNNDLDLCRLISLSFDAGRAVMIEPVEDPRILRAVIGQADAFVGCRFHSVVAALSMGVPSLVIGWSHKYEEMMAMLQPGRWFIDAAGFSAKRLEELFSRLEPEMSALHRGIGARLPGVRERARDNFVLAAGMVNS